MARPVAVSQLNTLGLSEEEFHRATTWMPEIAIALSPGDHYKQDGNAIRVGSKGSLKVTAGFWYSFEADETGRDPVSEIQFLRPDWGPAVIRQYLVNWLQEHPGEGRGIIIQREGEEERVARYAAFATGAIKIMALLTGTPAEPYCARRSIPGERPGLLGWLPDDARVGEGALAAVARDANGEPACVQLGYLNALGEKVEVRGTERRHFWINPDAVNVGFYVRPDPFDPTAPLYLCEGLENALSLALARPAARIIGLPGIGHLRRHRTFKGQRIVVFRDGDAPESPARRALTKGLDALLLGGAVVNVTNTPDGQDANSLLQTGGIAAMEEVLATTEPAKLSPRGAVAKGANLHGIDYEATRKDLAKEAGITVTALDGFVKDERDRRRVSVEITERDIHPEPVDNIAEVLDTARADIAKYVVASPEQLDMVTMWSLHTHFVHHAIIDIAISPRLAITAPTADCGKTTLLEACGELSHRAQECSTITAAGFFHLHQEERRTLLIDEAQSILGKKGNDTELQGVLLASHRRRSAKVIRAVEINKQFVSKEFDAWCTFAMTYTGKLAYALEPRCLKVTLKRAKPGEVEQHLLYGTSEILVDCRRKFARWAEDQISLPNVELPKDLYNRRGDNWRPLFQIAEAVGGHWREKIKAAALASAGIRVVPDVVIALLTDLSDVLWDPRKEKPRERMLTDDMVAGLTEHKAPSWDWKTCNRGGPVNRYWLRDNLAGVLDPPNSQRWREKTSKHPLHGYTFVQFEDAFERYSIASNHKVQEADDLGDISAKRGDSSDTSGSSDTATKNHSPVQESSPVPDAGEVSGTPSGTPPDSAPLSDSITSNPAVPDSVPDTPKPIRRTKNRSSGLKKSKVVLDVPDVLDKTRVSRKHIQKPQSIVEKVDETW
jgi:hypothetical protein